VQVRVFGAVRLIDAAGDELHAPSVSQRRVLALLAAQHGRPIRGDRVCELLEISAGTLRTTISRLRKAVGAEVIANDSAGYRLLVDSSDAELLEAAARSADAVEASEAVQIRQDALAMVASRPYEEFAAESWIHREVVRLDDLRAEMAESQASSLFLLSRHDEGVQLMLAHIGEFPFRDQARALLMEGLARTGRQVEALRAYEDYRLFLAEEAGAVPSQELQELSNEIAIGEVATTVSAIGDADVIDVTDAGTDSMIDQDLVAYLVTDLVGSTRIRVDLGDRAATPLLAAADELQRSCVAEFRGRIVQGTGDGVTAWFVSVTDAIEAMLEIGERIAELGGPGETESGRVKLSLRGVVDVGDVDWDGTHPTGPLVDRAAAAVDAIRGDELTCSELAAVLVATGEFSFDSGPLPGLVIPQRLVEPAR